MMKNRHSDMLPKVLAAVIPGLAALLMGCETTGGYDGGPGTGEMFNDISAFSVIGSQYKRNEMKYNIEKGNFKAAGENAASIRSLENNARTYGAMGQISSGIDARKKDREREEAAQRRHQEMMQELRRQRQNEDASRRVYVIERRTDVQPSEDRRVSDPNRTRAAIIRKMGEYERSYERSGGNYTIVEVRTGAFGLRAPNGQYELVLYVEGYEPKEGQFP